MSRERGRTGRARGAPPPHPLSFSHRILLVLPFAQQGHPQRVPVVGDGRVQVGHPQHHLADRFRDGHPLPLDQLPRVPGRVFDKGDDRGAPFDGAGGAGHGAARGGDFGADRRGVRDGKAKVAEAGPDVVRVDTCKEGEGEWGGGGFPRPKRPRIRLLGPFPPQFPTIVVRELERKVGFFFPKPEKRV